MWVCVCTYTLRIREHKVHFVLSSYFFVSWSLANNVLTGTIINLMPQEACKTPLTLLSHNPKHTLIHRLMQNTVNRHGEVQRNMLSIVKLDHKISLVPGWGAGKTLGMTEAWNCEKTKKCCYRIIWIFLTVDPFLRDSSSLKTNISLSTILIIALSL